MYFGRLHIFSFGHFRIFFLIIVTDQPYQCTTYSLRKSGKMDIADSVRPQILFQKFLFFFMWDWRIYSFSKQQASSNVGGLLWEILVISPLFGTFFSVFFLIILANMEAKMDIVELNCSLENKFGKFIWCYFYYIFPGNR